MKLSDKEKIIAIITKLSLIKKRDKLPKNTTMYDVELRIIPEDIK